MKIKIGPYRNDLVPARRWEQRYEYWRAKKLGTGLYVDEKDYTWYDKLVFSFFDRFERLCRPINRWSNSRKRKVSVHVDYYDIWSADHTLAMIIAPTLKKLKEHQHGYPHVDNDDVPERLHMTNEQKEALNWDGTVDANHEARWNYVLDEMIWAFEQHADPHDNEAQFHHNVDQLEMVFTPLEDGTPASTLSFNHQKDPTKPKYWVDRDAKAAHHARMNNGVRLFAKYYEALWD